MDANQYQEFYQDFLIESAEHLESYERHLLAIENVAKASDYEFGVIEEPIQAIFRSIHTIKGLAGMMGFQDIKSYTHEAEDFLERVRSNTMRLNPERVDLMFTVFDTVKALVGKLAHPDAEPVDVQNSLDAIHRQTVSVHSPVTDTLVAKKEAVIAANSVQGRAASTLRVDTGRIDELMRVVGELVIGKNRLVESHKQQARSGLSQSAAATDDGTVQHMTRLITHLQDIAMKLRMVPVGHTFKKYQRMIRDLAKESGKEVILEIEGEDTEVDRGIIEIMDDPLLHILRNAIDHGLETPEIRTGNGKQSAGTIRMSAYQENNMIVIRIQDDGRGMDPQALYWKAIEKGFVEPSSVLSEKEKLNLIFMPGFSTAGKVTDVSGRGIGMDVVKKNILKVNGLIDLETEVGKGSIFTIRLPLTLAIIQTLLVKLNDARYAIPLTNVIETLRIQTSDIQWISGHEAVELRGQVLPIVRLNAFFGRTGVSTAKKIFVVVLGFAEQRIGCVVDELLEQQDIVIKPLGEYLENVEGVSGATILGNGDVCLVLDMANIWEKEISKTIKEVA